MSKIVEKSKKSKKIICFLLLFSINLKTLTLIFCRKKKKNAILLILKFQNPGGGTLSVTNGRNRTDGNPCV